MKNDSKTAVGSYLLLTDGALWRVTDGVSINTDMETVRVGEARRPNTNWSHTDSHGHAHKYYRDEEDVPRLPSLERRDRRVECDGACGNHGDCEGYMVAEWFCRECGDLVEPGFVSEYDVTVPVAAVKHYAVTVETDGALSREPIEGAMFVSAAADGSERRWPLPTLHSGDSQMSFGGGERPVVRTELHGTEYRSVEHKPVGP